MVVRKSNLVRHKAKAQEEGFETSKTRVLGIRYKEQSLYQYFYNCVL